MGSSDKSHCKIWSVISNFRFPIDLRLKYTDISSYHIFFYSTHMIKKKKKSSFYIPHWNLNIRHRIELYTCNIWKFVFFLFIFFIYLFLIYLFCNVTHYWRNQFSVTFLNRFGFDGAFFFCFLISTLQLN